VNSLNSFAHKNVQDANGLSTAISATHLTRYGGRPLQVGSLAQRAAHCFVKLGVAKFSVMFASGVRRTIPNSTWAEIRTAYASGIGLREIARNMNIPEGTVLSRAKRDG
jgi:hypothetical protein